MTLQNVIARLEAWAETERRLHLGKPDSEGSDHRNREANYRALADSLAQKGGSG
jgi:hypothetical protein